MAAEGSLAMIPKARGMYAKRLTMAEYEELMRRRTVPEVAAILRRHPYFGDSLATLSPLDPHRGQIEELLNQDLFRKYETLVRYDFSLHSFAAYYLDRLELNELLKMLHLLSVGAPGDYMRRLPTYLEGRGQIDLYRMAGARSLEELLAVLQHTAYHKPVKALLDEDPALQNFPRVEATLLKLYYGRVFALLEACFSGRERASVQGLFSQEAELHNLSLLVRLKTFYPKAFTPEQTMQLLLPYTLHLRLATLKELAKAPTLETLAAQIRQTPAARYLSPDRRADIAALGDRVLYAYARRLLHLTSSPAAALAAFLVLAELERENIVNVIEGVRYGLPPERMRAMLRQ